MCSKDFQPVFPNLENRYVDQYENFCNRPINLALEILVKDGLDMSFGSGETWKRYRRLTHQHLLNMSAILKLEHEILDEIALTCAHFSKLAEQGGKVPLDPFVLVFLDLTLKI